MYSSKRNPPTLNNNSQRQIPQRLKRKWSPYKEDDAPSFTDDGEYGFSPHHESRSFGPTADDFSTGYSSDRQTRERGRFFGVAPKGYNRSDERIKEDVCDFLMRQGEFDPSEIEVEVNDGEVSLKGEIDSRQSKYHMEESLEGIPGVKHIENQLRITRTSKNKFDQDQADYQREKENTPKKDSNRKSSSEKVRPFRSSRS